MNKNFKMTVRTALLAHLFLALGGANHGVAAELPPTATIVVAGGCFWGMEAVFDHTKGVIKAVAGYAGGQSSTAHYATVSQGDTGHAESVQITYDPQQVSLPQLLDIFFKVAHNPTELNYQGPDHGTQYRSTVFYASPEQQKVVMTKIAELSTQHEFNQPIATTLEPLQGFYPAEAYHQHYAEQHPMNLYIMMNDAPKVAALAQMFPALYVP